MEKKKEDKEAEQKEEEEEEEETNKRVSILKLNPSFLCELELLTTFSGL